MSLTPFIATFLNSALKLNFFKEHDRVFAHTTRDIEKTISTYFEKEYVNKVPVASKSTKRKSNHTEEEDSDDDLYSFMYKRTEVDKNSKEINEYLSLPPLSNKKVNTLDYWKTQNAEFSFLTQMARDILPVQSASVCVERDFAGAVDVVIPTRCSLKHNAIREIMCVKSWYKS